MGRGAASGRPQGRGRPRLRLKRTVTRLCESPPPAAWRETLPRNVSRSLESRVT